MVGFLVGSVLGRIFMRIIFLAGEATLGFETALGAVLGDVTAGGTLVVGVAGGFFGLVLGHGCVALRPLLPSALWVRELVFVLAATVLLLARTSRGNREDFSLLPLTPSLALIAGSVALTAVPAPLLVERLAPDRERSPGVIAQAAVGLGLAGSGVSAALAIADA